MFAIFLFDIRASAPLWRRSLCWALFAFSTLLCVYYCFYFLRVCALYGDKITTVAMLDALVHAVFCLAGIVAEVFIIHIQRKDRLRTFVGLLTASNAGGGCVAHEKALRRYCVFFNLICWFNVIYGIAYIGSYSMGFRPANLDPIIARVFHYDELYVLHLFSIIYLFIGWNIAIQVYVLCTVCAIYTLRDLHNEIKRIAGDSEQIAQDISDCIRRLSLFSTAVGCLNESVKRYAFLILALSIPGTLFTLFEAISIRHQPLSDMLMIGPSLFCTIYGFISIAYFPAELHETALQTRTLFCSNTRIWSPYREKAYSAALIFLSYIEHAELGISAWGFATLSRPAILTTISVMVTFLALLLQIHGCTPEDLKRM